MKKIHIEHVIMHLRDCEICGKYVVRDYRAFFCDAGKEIWDSYIKERYISGNSLIIHDASMAQQEPSHA